MPANSGRQESVICRHLQKAYNKHPDMQKLIRLYTYDNTWDKKQTNIDPRGVIWKHTKCKDIFTELCTYTIPSLETMAWFDLTGGLTDANKVGLQQCVQKLFAPGSLLFITLQVHGVRGVSNNNTREVYNSWAESPHGRVIITDSLLKEAVSETNKSIRTIMEPYVYRHNTTTYAVYGYIVAER